MASPSHVLVVAAGDVDAQELASLVMATDPARPERPFVVAADGGAAPCLSAGVRPDVVVGDFDSLDPTQLARLQALGVELRVTNPDKDESDMELSLLAAVATGTARITILGALGVERPEHGIANILLLGDPRLDDVDVAIVGHGSRIMRLGTARGPGEAQVAGVAGDFVSLFPLGGGVEGVSTEGLRFPLRDERLPMGPSRGLSNELLGTSATVSTRLGCLLLVHTARAQSEA